MYLQIGKRPGCGSARYSHLKYLGSNVPMMYLQMGEHSGCGSTGYSNLTATVAAAGQTGFKITNPENKNKK